MVGTSNDAVVVARKGAKRVAKKAREQALAGYGYVTGQPKPVRSDIATVELVVVAGEANWWVRCSDRLYEIDDDAARQLTMLVPATTLATAERQSGVATFSAASGPGTTASLELRGGADTRTIKIDTSAAAVLAPVTVEPQPFKDDWLQTTFAITAESTERLEVHLYLPPNDELPPKRYLVLADGAELATGELPRDGHSTIMIDAPAPPTGRIFDVHLAYSDPAPESDQRRLGAVLKGVTKWLDPRGF